LLKNHISGFIFGEQTALNLFFYKRWEKLPLVYNVYVNFIHDKLPKHLKSIVLHFVQHRDYPPLWNPQHIYFNEWKKNLEKAEKIDLSNIPEIRKWSPYKIYFYSMLLKLFVGHKRCLLNFKNAPDKFLGHAGEIINKLYPGLYVKLKKIKGEK
jgi:lipopolysaccharide biosynthesis glycosyltransferase